MAASKAMNTRIERGKRVMPYTLAARSSTTSAVADPDRSSRPRAAMPIAVTHDLAQQALWAEDQDQDQDREREDVLVLRAECPAAQQREIRGRERFEQPQDDAAHHRARDVADAAQHGRGEGLEPG